MVQEMDSSQGTGLFLYKHFTGTMYEVMTFFNVSKISDLENVTPEMMWDCFNNGRLFLGCKMSKRQYNFVSVGGNGGDSVQLSCDDLDGRKVSYNIPRQIFIKPEDYILACSFFEQISFRWSTDLPGWLGSLRRLMCKVFQLKRITA